MLTSAPFAATVLRSNIIYGRLTEGARIAERYCRKLQFPLVLQLDVYVHVIEQVRFSDGRIIKDETSDGESYD